jgi:hypothetical protein
MENCPVCIAAKMKYHARGTETTRKATWPFQGFSIDFAFAGQRSRDKTLRLILLDTEAKPATYFLLIISPKSYSVQQEYRKSLLLLGFKDSSSNTSQKVTLKTIDTSSWTKVVNSIHVWPHAIFWRMNSSSSFTLLAPKPITRTVSLND